MKQKIRSIFVTEACVTLDLRHNGYFTKERKELQSSILRFVTHTNSEAGILRVALKKDARKIKALLESRYSQGLIDPWKQDLRAPYWGVGEPRIQQA